MDRLLENGGGAPLVRLDGVTKRYGNVRALDDVTLDIARGEWLAVMGPSGSGKTTLLNLLAGLDGADEGRITVGDVRLDALSEEERTRYRRERVGLVFQQFHLLPYLSALENVMVAQHYHSMADAGEAAAALDRVGLGDKLGRRPSQLSGGEQQRVCIARALINSPSLLLADEPTGNLDADNEARVLEIFSDLHRAGHTLVVVTHAEHVGGLADRRIQLAHGRVTDLLPSRTELEERYDHFLESMWYLRESGASVEWRAIRLHDVAEIEPTARAVEERGLAVRDGARVAFTQKGESRARDLVRRHRLAECLMAGTLHLSDPEVNATACRMEHILDRGATEAICGFLRHPTTCPHAKPIPAGACCPNGGRAIGS